MLRPVTHTNFKLLLSLTTMETLRQETTDGAGLRQITVHSLIEQMDLAITNPTIFLGNDQQVRQKLLQQAKALAIALEEPFETLQRLAFAVSYARFCYLPSATTI